MLKKIAFGFLLVVILLFTFGPGWSYVYAPSIVPVEITSSVENYIKNKEAHYNGVKPGNEPAVIWSGGADQKTDYVLVYLHGFSASPKEISPVVETLAQDLKMNAYLPRLASHGLKPGLMEELTDDQLFQDAEESYQIAKKMGDKVIIIGTSTGATLALWLAQRHPDVAAQVLLSPNLGINDPRGFLASGPIGYWIARMVVGPEYTWKAHYPHQEEFWTTRYSVNGVRVMTDVVNVVCSLDFSKIAVPSLVMWTSHDNVIDLPKALGLLKKMPSSKNTFIESSSTDHVLAGNITSPATTASAISTIRDFVLKTTAK
jgi:esterase/lipase